MQIVLGTNNSNKLKEIRPLFPFGFELLSMQECGVEIHFIENQKTILENAISKAWQLWASIKSPCFCDDTGLEVEALQGAPGVHSARFYKETATYQENNTYLLKKMENIKNRKARFVTVIAFINENKIHHFTGYVEGSIMETPMGKNGFGYDSLFLPKGKNQTFAQMPLSEKNNISHRYQAIKKFIKHLETIVS